MNSRTHFWLGFFVFVIGIGTSAFGAQTLTIITNGNGAVVASPSSPGYPQNSVVTLTASASPNWQFSGWSGDINGTLNPTNVLMNGDKTITANFTLIPTFTLTVNVSGSGGVSPNGGTFPSNSTVQLMAQPGPNGWAFHHWSGDASGSTNPLSITMSSHKTVTAVFIQPVAITGQPHNATAAEGGTANFSVTANGTGPLSYLWRFNGTPIPGADSAAFAITNVQAANGGPYDVIVSNPYGAVTSAVALLTVSCPGTNVVTVASDAALRAAIAIGGHVRLCFGGTVLLTNTIPVVRNVSLDASATTVVIDGGGAVRLFDVSTNVTFHLTNVTLANGTYIGTNGPNATMSGQAAGSGEDARGAAIRNNGATVRLFDCVVSNHFVQGGDAGVANQHNGQRTRAGGGQGAAIFNAGGRVELFRTSFLKNRSSGGFCGIPGGFAFVGTNGFAQGGAICSLGGSVVALDCTFAANVASNRNFSPIALPPSSSPWSKGGALYGEGASLALTNCEVIHNRAISQDSSTFVAVSTVAGGAVATAFGTLIIDRSRFVSNDAAAGYSPQLAGASAHGGAVFNGDNLRITASTFRGNSAVGGSGMPAVGTGGAIQNVVDATIVGSTFSENICRGGYGRSTGPLTGFAGMDAKGGAVQTEGLLFVTNCTFVANSAVGGNAGGYDTSGGNAYGGAIHGGESAQSMTLVHVTIASNIVNGGAFVLGGTNGYSFGANIASTNYGALLRNSIVAYAGTNQNIWGVVTDGGYNICSDGSANTSSGTSFNFTDPRLLALADNGGPTLTMALASDSPAIDWIPANLAATVDQRGFTRPYGILADVGAFEAGPAMPPLMARRNGASLAMSFLGQVGINYRLLRSSDLQQWETEQITGPLSSNGIWSATFPLTAPQRYYQLRLEP